MKKLFCLAILCFSVGHIFAQIDSVTFVNASWQQQPIAKKAVLKTYHFTGKSLFEANEYISFVEVNPKKSHLNIDLAAAQKLLKTTSSFALENQAEVALNGTFFDVKNGGSVDLIKIKDSLINQSRIDGKRASHQKAAITIKRNKLRIIKWDGSPDWESKINAPTAMVSGPLLLLDRNVEKLDTVAFNRVRHPRTAIGIKKNGNVILLTVDGRNENSAGMSLFELTKTMQWLGCKSALNLDGGGSTTLWVKAAEGVVNFPSDNKKWDHEGERKVANVILLRKQ